MPNCERECAKLWQTGRDCINRFLIFFLLADNFGHAKKKTVPSNGVVLVGIERFHVYPYIELPHGRTDHTIMASLCVLLLFFSRHVVSVVLLNNSCIQRIVQIFFRSALFSIVIFFFCLCFPYFRLEYVLSITRGFTCHKRCRTFNILKVNVNVFAAKLCKFY